MKIFSVDLYEYFKVKKQQEVRGILTCYIKDEFSENGAFKHLKPSILVIPGGGYSKVSNREKEQIALQFLAKGYNAFCLEYSVAPIRYPTPLIESCMAMTYIRKNAEELGVNKESVGAIGFSAGGHLLGLLSNLCDDECVSFLKEYNEEIKPNAVIYGYSVISGTQKPHLGSFYNLFGEEDYLSKVEEFSINKLINKNSPPAFIFATCNDNVVPVKNSLLLANAYEENGVPFSLHIFTSGIHGLSVGDKTVYLDDAYSKVKKNTSKNYTKWFEMSINFLEEVGFFRKEIILK